MLDAQTTVILDEIENRHSDKMAKVLNDGHYIISQLVSDTVIASFFQH